MLVVKFIDCEGTIVRDVMAEESASMYKKHKAIKFFFTRLNIT